MASAEEVIGSSASLGDSLHGVCRLLVPAVADYCEISLAHDGAFVRHAAKHVAGNEITNLLAAQEGAARAIRERTPIVCAPVAGTSMDDANSALFVALRTGERVVGVLSLVNTGERPRLADGEIAIARAIAPRTAAAVEMARLLESERRARQLAEHALARRAEAEARLLAVAEHSNAIIYVVDLKGVFAFANRSYEETFKHGPVVGRSMFEVFPEPVARLFAEEDQRVAESGQPMQFEEEVPQADGIHNYVTMLFPLRDAAGVITHIGGISTDITERKRIDQSLRQAQKMELVGRLAGGIAHEYNNVLTTIAGNCEIVLRELLPESQPYERIKRIERSVERAAKLTHRLLVVAHRHVREAKALDLNDVIRELDAEIRQLIGPKIRLELTLADDLTPIFIDQGDLKDILVNLIANARDAMPAGGTLRIATSSSDGTIALEVADSGHGMTPEVRARIFEPFFTTKAPGEAIGLGLATVLATVEEGGGHLDVVSAPNAGTRVRIELPMATAQPALPQRAVAPPSPESKTILVVEDEEEVREVLQAVLRMFGYSVATASDGIEALDVLHHGSDHVVLVLSDVVMPRMDGFDLVHKVRAEWPQMRILLMTGYPGETVERFTKLDAIDGFFTKPFEMDVLVQRIQALIGPSSTSRTA